MLLTTNERILGELNDKEVYPILLDSYLYTQIYNRELLLKMVLYSDKCRDYALLDFEFKKSEKSLLEKIMEIHNLTDRLTLYEHNQRDLHSRLSCQQTNHDSLKSELSVAQKDLQNWRQILASRQQKPGRNDQVKATVCTMRAPHL